MKQQTQSSWRGLNLGHIFFSGVLRAKLCFKSCLLNRLNSALSFLRGDTKTKNKGCLAQTLSLRGPAFLPFFFFQSRPGNCLQQSKLRTVSPRQLSSRGFFPKRRPNRNFGEIGFEIFKNQPHQGFQTSYLTVKNNIRFKIWVWYPRDFAFAVKRHLRN